MKKSELIMNIIIIIIMVVISITVAYVAKCIIDDNHQVYVQKWTSPETGVCYYITETSIVEMHNTDGSLYSESLAVSANNIEKKEKRNE